MTATVDDQRTSLSVDVLSGEMAVVPFTNYLAKGNISIHWIVCLQNVPDCPLRGMSYW